MFGKNRKRYIRILSSILALVSVLSLIPMQVFSADQEMQEGQAVTGSEAAFVDDTFALTLDGVPISSLLMYPNEKLEIRVEGIGEGASYQWQILHPKKADLWVNIYDATKQSLPVTLALVGNMLSADDTAQLRCRVTVNGETVVSPVLTVEMGEEVPAAAVIPAEILSVSTETPEQEPGESLEEIASLGEAQEPGDSEEVFFDEEPMGEAAESEDMVEVESVTFQSAYRGSALMAAAEDELPEYVTITIEYIRYNNVQQPDGSFQEMETGLAFSSYVATLKSQAALEKSVHCPTMVGYTPSLVSVTEGGVKRDPYEGEFIADTEDVVIHQPEVKADVIYRVEYRPAMVNYEVRYYFQNIYDDLYVEDNAIINSAGITEYPVKAQGKTGLHPDATHTQRVFPGFTSLYYEPETIAADGSTEFEVYYERNYYLMEFDCDGGYGTDTLYVRYGTYIAVPEPVRSGYSFGGWDLVKTDEANHGLTLDDGKENELPKNMPPYNTAYRAIWTQADTTYSVAYWLVNSDGSRSYLGGVLKDGKTGAKVNGEHDLKAEGEDGSFPICGTEAHQHSAVCCSEKVAVEHTHTIDCIDSSLGWNGGNIPGGNGIAAIKAVEDGGEPQSGYVYLLYIQGGKYWPKLYLEDKNGNGDYYNISGIDGNTQIPDAFWNVVDGQVGESVTSVFPDETIVVTKYKAKAICGNEPHVHGKACCTSEVHSHDSNCYPQNLRYLEGVDTVTVTKEDEKTEIYTTDKDVVIEGDGSTVVNVYYQYKEYTLKFYYARSQTTATGGTQYFVVGGTSYPFSTDAATTDDGTQLGNVKEWGEVDELPTLNEEGNKRDYTPGTLNNNGFTYYFISFKARYGDDISELWPCSVFNSVTRTSANTHGYWSGMEAFVSAWNGEHYVKYSERSNKTIKGKYERLDDEILFNPTRFTGDYDQVSYLCFWENGYDKYWSIPELYRYKIWLEGNAPNGEPTAVRDGVTFYLADSYDTCDDSDVRSQTQPGLTGYKKYYVQNQDNNNYQYANTESGEKFENKSLAGQFDTSLYKEGYEVNFYYIANRHSLKFYNYNDWLEKGQGAGNTQEGGGVRYGTPLSVFEEYVTKEGFMDSHYPSGLEPGAYEFDGWYTTELCLPDTEVDWSGTMPDSDLVLYAKWKPVIHDVYFYYDYQDYLNGETWNGVTETDDTTITYPIKVKHDDRLETAYNKTPDAEDGYTYVGWFYIDETGKKKFAPDTMEVKKELHLFAEWQTAIDTQYKVTYVLDEEAPIGGVTYPAGTPIAEETAGHLTVGKTKTFEAKAENQLLEQFRNKPLFPTVNSHSILMEPLTEENANTYEFRYVYDAVVWYKVRYVDKITGVDLAPAEVKPTNHAIVTEKFKPFTGYIPADYYITKVLASDGEEGSADNVNELNEIIFYYTPDTEHGVYVIQYYTEKLNYTSEDDKWHLEQSELVSEDLKTDGKPTVVTVNVDQNKFNGFKYKESKVVTYEDGTEKESVVETDTLSGTLTEHGLEIKIYYTRKEYPYVVEYREYGADEDAEALWTSTELDLKGKFEETVSWSLVDGNRDDIIYEAGNKTYKYIDENDENPVKSIDIRVMEGTENPNKIIFYFNQKRVEIRYYAVWKEKLPEGKSAGHVSIASEIVGSTDSTGADAYAEEGFRFVGWYKDDACTDAVDTSWVNDTKLSPEPIEDEDWINEYYALFAPAKENLTITNNGENLNGDTFLFQVTGTDVLGNAVDMIVSIQGQGSVTIRELYCGTYTVTPLTSWSWAYSTEPEDGSVTLTTRDETETYKVEFGSAPVEKDWLHSESAANENQFTLQYPKV